MALNFWHCPVSPANLSEGNLVFPVESSSGYFFEGILENNDNDFVKPWKSFREVDECFVYERDITSGSGSQESAKDILDLLPLDPFGMDISNTFTVITGWLEDLGADYNECERNNFGNNGTDFELFTGLNFIWDDAMKFQSFPERSAAFGEKCNLNFKGVPSQDLSRSVSSMEGISSFDHINSVNSHLTQSEFGVVDGSCSDLDEEIPHAALLFAFGCLGVRDLLSIERVCKSFCYAVRSDPLLWKIIHIDHPLNEKITNNVLLQLTSRAQGNLQCLNLVECPRITDDGLRHVLESNPKITKLSVPGCTRLSIEGVVSMVKSIRLAGAPGIKHLRIGGLYGISKTHFEELKSLLDMDSQINHTSNKRHFYMRGLLYIPCDDERSIDIEVCPKCQNLRLIYDCPSESCQVGEHGPSSQRCRACTLCIERCVQCGRCVNNGEYEETFCLELICSDCWKQILSLGYS